MEQTYILLTCLVLQLVFATSMSTDYYSSGRLNDYETVIPKRIDERGHFLTFDVSSPERHKRDIGMRDVNKPSTLHYHVPAFGQSFKFKMTLNKRLASEKMYVEDWSKDRINRFIGISNQCHYIGTVYYGQNDVSTAVMSNCVGLHGFFTAGSERYFIEPLHNASQDGHPHIVYKESAIKGRNGTTQTCESPDVNNKATNYKNLKPHHYGYHNKDKWHSRRRRSVSQERYVETLIVADKSMVSYHGKQHIEGYILSIMNMVAALYSDESIGNAINIVVTRIILLSDDQPTLEISHHADKSLDSFCRWQQKVKPSHDSSTSGVASHDNAILLTRLDICTYKNEPCGTLGLAPVAGMCEEDRSCSINEDIGLASAFTIAHEMGHNFGMQHDGAGNMCGTPGHEPAKLMASQLTKNTDPFSWSACSRDYITGFLDSGRGKCLENLPAQNALEYPTTLPGESHSAEEQCKLQYGMKSRTCRRREMCHELWCTNHRGVCTTNSIPAVEGTSCMSHRIRNGWCYRGKCIERGNRPDSVDGKWGVWSSWGICSRTCGGGVESSERQCDNPRPQHGGKYCLGERKRYRSCNVQVCSGDNSNFREQQCQSFNDVPFRGKYYNWLPFNGGQVNPCAVNCLAVGFNFYTERAPKVIDGTHCYPDRHDICINGECRSVGCDKILGSSATEDKCRVCGGDGSTCETVTGYVNDPFSEGSYQEVLTIPKGAVHIKVEETMSSDNYLALRSEDGQYYINGAWTIDWPRNFEVAGTVFHYLRPHAKPESLAALGPTKQNLSVMLLLQGTNKGIKFQYNLPIIENESNEVAIVFTWQYSTWSECTKTCGKGMSTSKAVCMRQEDESVVESSYCSQTDVLHDLTKLCNEEPCPPEWVIGDWSECGRTCGGGIKSRTVLCMQWTDEKEQQIVDQSKCQVRKPKSRMTCNRNRCSPVWLADVWSECSADCGTGVQSRRVYCMDPETQHYLAYKSCDLNKRPPSRISCDKGNCPPPEWVTGEWGQCSSDCGQGQQRRTVVCRKHNGKRSNDCNRRTKPTTVQSCSGTCNVIDETIDGEECRDVDNVGYCPLVLKFQFCSRPYFRKMCCLTCRRIMRSG